MAHAAIASFLGDTAEAMLEFARVLPASVPRIALVDFNNDSVRDSLYVLDTLFEKYRELMSAGNTEEAAKYKLYGVRLDTSGSIRDVSVPPLGDAGARPGCHTAAGLQRASGTGLSLAALEPSQTPGRPLRARYCRGVKIVVSGGFNPDRIRKFEHLGVPVDIYAVGSYLFNNNGATVTDFTADVVRVKVHGRWVDMAKVGRKPRDNPDLKRVW